MKKRIPLFLICLILFTLSSCTYGRNINLQQNKLNELSTQITALKTQLDDTEKKLLRREAELESIRFELDALRKEVLEIRSPSISPEQTQGERLVKLMQELNNPLCDTNKIAFEMRKSGKRAAIALLEALKKNDIEYRTRVEKTFSGLLAEDATALLLPNLKDPLIRISIAHILGDLKDYSAVTELGGFLSADDEDFLFAVSEALVKLKDKKGVPVLIEFLRKTDLNKRVIAFNLLNKITGLTLDFKYYGQQSEVLEGAKKWEDWWVKNAPTFIFPTDENDHVPKLVQ